MASAAHLFRDAKRHHAGGRLDLAESLYRRVIKAEPGHSEALCLLGSILGGRGALDEAEQCYARALEFVPSLAPAIFARGMILNTLKREAEAVECFERALDVDPSHVGACLQLGNLVFERDQDAGIRYFQRAHEIDPTHTSARTCLTLGHVAVGARYSEREDWTAVFASYRRALEVDPNHAGAHWNLAVALLQHGVFDEGWREYEWRWKWKDFPDKPRGFAQPLWMGEPIHGARILLHAEQGLGDAIQFSRYAPMVAERGATVLLEVPRPLVRLMRSLPGVETVIARGESLAAFDWQCPLMSLPLAFGTTKETIPAQVPYLAAVGGGTASTHNRPDLRCDRPAPRRDGLCPRDEGSSSRRDGPASHYAAAAGARTIGLVWAGSPAHLRDQRRSIGLDLFAPLTQIDGFQWYSLQKGPAAAALSALQPGLNLVDLAAGVRDFADTAAIVANLDLVITVDTSVAHLAGALGKPVWILVPKPSDWRWMLDREDSPWYPTARLFRQSTAGDWAPVVERVHEALRRREL